MQDFVLGHIHSHPGPRVGHPCCRGTSHYLEKEASLPGTAESGEARGDDSVKLGTRAGLTEASIFTPKEGSRLWAQERTVRPLGVICKPPWHWKLMLCGPRPLPEGPAICTGFQKAAELRKPSRQRVREGAKVGGDGGGSWGLGSQAEPVYSGYTVTW